MKKTLSLLLALVMCLTLLPTVTLAASGDAVGTDELEITNQNIDFGTVSHGDDVSDLKCTVTVTNVSDRTLYYPIDNSADYFNKWESDLFEAKGVLMGTQTGYNLALAKLLPEDSVSMTIYVNETFMNMKSGQQTYTYYLKFASEQGKRYQETLAAPVDGYTRIVDTTVYTTFPITVTLNINGEATPTKTRGVDVTDDEFTISATTIDFGTVPYGKSCEDQYITVTNTSDRRLYINFYDPDYYVIGSKMIDLIYKRNVTYLDPGGSVTITAHADTGYAYLSPEDVAKLPTNFKCADEFYISSQPWELRGGWTNGAASITGTPKNDNHRTFNLMAKVTVAPPNEMAMLVENDNMTIEKDLYFEVDYSSAIDKLGKIGECDWKPDEGEYYYRIYSDYFTITNSSDVTLEITNRHLGSKGDLILYSNLTGNWNAKIDWENEFKSKLKPGESLRGRLCLELGKSFYADERADKTFETVYTIDLEGKLAVQGSVLKKVENPITIKVTLNMINKTGLNPLGEKPSPWAEAEVAEAIAANIIPFQLQEKYTQPTTRLEFCEMATRLYEIVKGKNIAERATFTDTTNGSVQKMAGLGVVNGVGNGRFDPYAQLTREQAATMLARLANVMGKPMSAATTGFGDNAKISSWAKDAVGQVQKAGVMNGVGNNMFSPQTNYTREQSILTILRMFHYVK